jgi:hypothetical protein
VAAALLEDERRLTTLGTEIPFGEERKLLGPSSCLWGIGKAQMLCEYLRHTVRQAPNPIAAKSQGPAAADALQLPHHLIESLGG